jgi:hypothetical protein
MIMARKSNDYVEGHESGIDAGWSNANFTEAYGDPLSSAESSLEARRGSYSDHYRDGWLKGYPVGVKRFRTGRFTDGTRIPD